MVSIKEIIVETPCFLQPPQETSSTGRFSLNRVSNMVKPCAKASLSTLLVASKSMVSSAVTKEKQQSSTAMLDVGRWNLGVCFPQWTKSTSLKFSCFPLLENNFAVLQCKTEPPTTVTLTCFAPLSL